MNSSDPSMYGAGQSNNFDNMSSQDGGAQWFQNDMDYGFDDDPDGDLGGNLEDGGVDSRDPKRRRIARACDMCRKKKIKCDGRTPKCSHCENYKTECIFTHVEKKRAPPKGAKYIEGLENRLGRMESLLRLSGLLGEDDGGRTDLGTLEKRLAERTQNKSDASSPRSNTPVNRPNNKPADVPVQKVEVQDTASPPNGNVASPDSSTGPPPAFKRDQKEVDALADQMCSLITNNCGETRYIGSSSGFSIFSPKGIQWVNNKTGDSSFQQMIASASSDDKMGWDHWKPEVFNDLFQRRVFKPLPSRQECYALLKDYFENFNCMFPLFHEPTFMHLVDKHYSLEPYEGSGWWASLNVALAIAHRLRVMSNVVGQEEDDIAWAYLKNAMAVMTELTMKNMDLLSVQALLGMALFLQGTPNPQPSFFLISAAIRVAHSIGLHKRGSGFNLNGIEDEQRKRVFWIAYMMDKDICLRSGRPPAQDDDDMNVDLPSENPPDNVGNIPLEREADGKKTLNLFRLMCTFAQIQSRVYKQLYSVRASQQSDGELLNTIGDLDAQLEEWKDSIPIDFRPEHEIKAAHTPLILHVVVLHFAYYNCLTTIHRMSVHHGYWTSRLSDYAIQGLNARPLNPRVFMSAALCVNAARTSIGLIRYIPQGDYACVWLILYYPVSALVTLFANILQNPQDARARSDLKLMASVVSFLTMLERDVNEANGNVKRMLSVCAEFERIARVALDKAEREIRGRGKRKLAEREREKAMKDRGSGQVVSGLEEGKTLEQMQIETQASYRRPVQTPSLRASQEASSIAGSPNSWGATSPPGGTGPEYRTPVNRSAQLANNPQITTPNSQPHSSKLNGIVNSQLNSQQQQQQHSPYDPPLFPNSGSQSFTDFTSTSMPGGMSNFSPSSLHHHHQQQQQQHHQQHPGDFHNPSLSPDMNIPSPNTVPFQQPFVPQDLWQMPMTLEWDWAEGLGLGSFTPGPTMMDPIYADVENNAAAAAAAAQGMQGMNEMNGGGGGGHMNGNNRNNGNMGDGGFR